MGVDLGDLIEKQEIELEDLRGKKIAIDALNAIYQFLSIIRQPDGTPLIDSNKNITSHLSGLFYRTTRLMEIGIIPCYVFDGEPPKLKSATVEERKEIRREAEKKWKAALEAGELAEARKYAQAASRVTESMLEESKKLLNALGIPVVQAPSEGEAQAAYICQQGDVYSVGSQDYDALLFGAPRLLRNITITGKRKVPRKNIYVEVKPEMIELDSAIKEIEVTREQLIEMGILIGTDFNEGVKGIGPKKSLAHIKEKSLKEWIKEGKFEFEVDVEVLKKIFLKPEITKNYSLNWQPYDQEKLIEILHEKHDFSKERIENALEKLEKSRGAKDQKSLQEWFR
ncbi:TPA: flap endonuclease-1 [archaeon]|uniref:Flap endonuclease 1 n=1 Tax=Candidatus Naiadarchaeum limnaeum TaxID=2756139 RepID=A0A832XIE8_9ARCH|nr:flap endonuclease-1 [Candidatus Naiadarchaeales archaeon SRR2090153.bin1042]HIK00666.1 flap endonuclease-1 [Candidatus Naiadarchaeum limnaeum]